MGSLTAGYSADCTAPGTAEVGGYGREILQMVYTAFATNEFPVVIATIYIQLYPYSPTQNAPPTANYSNALSSGSGPLLTFIPNVSVGNPPVNAFQGDPPRVTAQISRLYPGSTSWLIIYPNDPASNPNLTGAVSIANSTMTDTANNGPWSRTFTFDLASALIACGINQSTKGPQKYTVEAVEQLPAAYNNINSACPESASTQDISSVTFTVNLQVGVKTQLGAE